ncbi:MAG TPA: energy transducer TonB [Longimicrobiales bacterium]
MTPTRRALDACAAGILTCLAGPVHAQDAAAVPRILNVREIQRMLQDDFPDALRPHAVNTAALVRVYVAPNGAVDSVWLTTSTGLHELDGLAREAARRLRFAPVPAADSIALPIAFALEERESATASLALRLSDRVGTASGLAAVYPEDMRARGIGAYVGLSLLVDGAGRVIDRVLVSPSCLMEANDSALALVGRLAFTPSGEAGPAHRRTYATISFDDTGVELRLRGDTLQRDTTLARFPPPEGNGPTRRPELRNRGEVGRKLVASYPQDLRSAGVGGTASVHLRVNEEGRVTFRLIHTGSGQCGLDRAALEVAQVMRFEPALSRGRKVAAWVEIPIVFSTQ